MKKYFIIAAAAALTLAACSKVTLDEEIANQEISFQTANYVASTKASHNDNCATFDYTEDSFGVYAWYTANAFAPTTAAPNFMSNVAVSFEPTRLGDKKTNTWAPTTAAYYWPKSGKISFIGYYPHGATGVGYVATSDANPKVKFDNYEVAAALTAQAAKVSTKTVDEVTTVTKDQNDLMVADFIADQTANEDGDTHYRNGVAMVFRHKLAKVRLSVAQTDDQYNPFSYKIDLVSISIDNVNNSANFDGTVWSTEGTATAGTAASGSFGAKNNIVVLAHNGTAVDGAKAEKIGADYYVMPQALHADAVITVSYKVHTFDATNTEISVETFTKTTKLNEMKNGTTTLDKWEQNNIYHYTLNISPVVDEIFFDPCVIKWEEETTSSTTIISK